MMQLANHLQNLESEKHKLRTQVKRLSQENAWLRDELGSTQKKFHECQQINASYSVEIEHLQFFKNVQQFDIDNENSTNQTLSKIDTDSNHQQMNEQDLFNDLFPLDDNDNEQNDPNKFGSYMDQFILPSQSMNGSFISTTNYEIPTRLKTLHNLVIQYVSQGRYEVAIPLCRQALQDLEKTSGHQRKRFLFNHIFGREIHLY